MQQRKNKAATGFFDTASAAAILYGGRDKTFQLNSIHKYFKQWSINAKRVAEVGRKRQTMLDIHLLKATMEVTLLSFKYQ